MINLTSSGNSVTFSFSGQSGYLNNGEIVVPKNSLSLVLDTSDMAVFKKSNSDVFVAALVSDFGMTKDELEAWYKDNMVGGGGIASGDVQTMIDESISGKADSSAVTESINAAVSGKADTSSLATVATTGDYDDLTNKLSAGTNITIVDNVISAEGGGKAVSGGTNISITTGETADTINCTLNLENGTSSQGGGLKQISLGAGNVVTGRDACAFNGGNKAQGINAFVCGYYNTGNTSNVFITGYGNKTTNTMESLFCNWALSNGSNDNFNGDSGATAFAVGNGHYQRQIRHNAFEIRQNGDIYIADTNDTSTSNYYEKPMIKLQDALGGGGSSYTAGDGIDITYDVISVTGMVETSAITSSVTSASTDSEIPSAKAVWDAIPASITVDSAFDSGSTNPLANSAITDHLNTVESVIATSLVDLDNRKLDASAYTPTDLSNYYTSAQTESAITAAVSGKQDTLIAGDNITISGNVISASGGGTSYSAGRGINIDSADTISFNLPISAGTGSDSLIFNRQCTATGQYSIAFGRGSSAGNAYAFAIGGNTASGVNSFAGGYGGTVAIGQYSFAFGYNAEVRGDSAAALGGYFLKTNNNSEIAFGNSNVSRTGSTDDLKTIFTVGNGTNANNRHNAFEIRQNGDIYCSDGTNDVKLQDTITATAANTTALGGLSLVKLSQSAYDALATKDDNTLYVIVN